MRYLFETLELIKNKKLSVKEHLDELLENIKKYEDYNAFISLDLDKVNEYIKQAENNSNSELYGAFVGIKDNINVDGEKMTCASKILKDYVSIYDADVINFLKKDGAIPFGKLNMDEFAMGSSNETSYFGPVSNPIDKNLVPGGSSGGSAASVKLGLCDVSLGTDTGGSVRQPASFCSVVGIKPTYGLISRYGVTSLANTLDTVGTFGNCVRDAYLLLRSINKDTTKDMTKINVELPELISTEKAISELKGKKIARIKTIDSFHLDKEVKDAYENSLKKLEEYGAEIIEVDFKYLDYCVSCYYAIIEAEASSNLSRFDGVRFASKDVDTNDIHKYMQEIRGDGFGAEVKRRILSGMYLLSGPHRNNEYLKALKVRRAIAMDYENIFEKADAILSPTAINLPFKKGERNHDPRKMMEGDLLSVPINIAGVPAISVPTAKGNVINAGMQLIGAKKMDYNLVKLALAFEGVQ